MLEDTGYVQNNGRLWMMHSQPRVFKPLTGTFCHHVLFFSWGKINTFLLLFFFFFIQRLFLTFKLSGRIPIISATISTQPLRFRSWDGITKPKIVLPWYTSFQLILACKNKRKRETKANPSFLKHYYGPTQPNHSNVPD